MYAHDTSVYADRFKAFGFHIIVIDGHSIKEIVGALEEAKKQTKLPTAVICKTEKGKGFGEKIEGKLNWHGKDLGAEFDAALGLVQGRIKRQNIDFTTYAPEGDDVILDSPKVTIVPNYK